MAHEQKKSIEFARPNGAALTADLYRPCGSGRVPVVVGVHGGGWYLGDAAMHAHWGGYLAEHGIALFSVNYRLAAEGRKAYPEAVHDVRSGIQYLRAHAASLGIDSERIALFGDSAGAHLAALVALAGNRPPFAARGRASTHVKAVIGVYGVYDLVAQWQYDLAARPGDSICERFLGASLLDDRKLYFEASPLSYVTRDANQTAFLLAWGTEDDVVERSTQSETFLHALKQAGFYARSVIVPGAPHFWAAEPLEEPGSRSGFLAPRLLRFLRERL